MALAQKSASPKPHEPERRFTLLETLQLIKSGVLVISNRDLDLRLTTQSGRESLNADVLRLLENKVITCTLFLRTEPGIPLEKSLIGRDKYVTSVAAPRPVLKLKDSIVVVDLTPHNFNLGKDLISRGALNGGYRLEITDKDLIVMDLMYQKLPGSSPPTAVGSAMGFANNGTLWVPTSESSAGKLWVPTSEGLTSRPSEQRLFEHGNTYGLIVRSTKEFSFYDETSESWTQVDGNMVIHTSIPSSTRDIFSILTLDKNIDSESLEAKASAAQEALGRMSPGSIKVLNEYFGSIPALITAILQHSKISAELVGKAEAAATEFQGMEFTLPKAVIELMQSAKDQTVA